MQVHGCFQFFVLGLVSDFYSAGLVSAALNLHYGNGEGQTSTTGDLEAYEIQYAPYGVDSGLCVGTATTAAAGTKVSLQPCGVSSKTVWVQDWDNPAGAHLNYVPLIAGSDTNFSQPFVLTYSATAYPTDMPRSQLYTANLTGFPDQAHFTRRFKSIIGLTPGAYARDALAAPR